MRKMIGRRWLLTGLIAGLLLSACGEQERTTTAPIDPPPAESPGSGQVGPAGAEGELPSLPPPVILTDPETASAAAAAGGPKVQEVVIHTANPDEALPEEAARLIESILGGEAGVGSTAKVVMYGEPTSLYHDLNGDGVEDEIIIIVADEGALAKLTTVLNQGSGASAPSGQEGTVVIQAFKLTPGTTSAEVIVVGPNDIPCCPLDSSRIIEALRSETPELFPDEGLESPEVGGN